MLNGLAALNPEKWNALNIGLVIAAFIAGVAVYQIAVRRSPESRWLKQIGLALIVIAVALLSWLWLPRNL